MERERERERERRGCVRFCLVLVFWTGTLLELGIPEGALGHGMTDLSLGCLLRGALWLKMALPYVFSLLNCFLKYFKNKFIEIIIFIY
jgi:hypothetical protein